MKSKYHSTCKKCGKHISPGDEIANNNDGMGWGHSICPDGSLESAFAAAANQNVANKPGNNWPVTSVAVAPIAEVPFVPSKYQQALFDEIPLNTGNIVMEAVAGSGKSTTLKMGLKLVPAGKRAVLFAYNKHIAEPLDMWLKSQGITHVKATTIHAAGLALCNLLESRRGKKIDKYKVDGIMDAFWPTDKSVPKNERFTNRARRAIMRRLASLAKAILLDVNNREEVLAAIDRYGVDTDDLFTSDVVDKLPEVMRLCLEDEETIDFDDMVWMPLVHKRLKNFFEKYEYVFVDEAQDLNKSQIEFVMNCVSPTGRVIAVGDRKQSLYGFRGADTEAIPRLISMLEAKTLPLSISYRCPVSHVNQAKSLVPQIEAAENAKQGHISTIEYEKFLDTVDVGDMVICRTNAPLIAPAFELIRRGKKSVIRGAEIGKDLVTFVERFGAEDISQLEVLMGEYTAKEYERLMDKGKELQADLLLDKMATIMHVSQECVSVKELTDKMLALYDDKNEGVVFSSVHRAKGLEASNVFILHRELLPHPKAKQIWELEQEQNCLYVALTRSKDNLYFVKGG